MPKATTHPQLSALLAADIEAPVERILLARDREALRAQVLLVPHHGSKTSSTEPFLDSIDPLVPVFQVGYRNRFHHPHPGVFSRYVARHIELARSDTDGAVRIETAGGALSLERYRDTHRALLDGPVTFARHSTAGQTRQQGTGGHRQDQARPTQAEQGDHGA